MRSHPPPRRSTEKKRRTIVAPERERRRRGGISITIVSIEAKAERHKSVIEQTSLVEKEASVHPH
jgi:hypothetical protein